MFLIILQVWHHYLGYSHKNLKPLQPCNHQDNISFQCIPTTYVFENKEEKYLENYIFQVSCSLSLPLLNIPNCQSGLKFLSHYSKFVYTVTHTSNTKCFRNVTLINKRLLAEIIVPIRGYGRHTLNQVMIKREWLTDKVLL